MVRYNLHNDGKCAEVGYDENLTYETDGTEPWIDDWTTSSDWQFVGGVWSKWIDRLEESDPVFMSSQDISNKPGNPNITRKAFILEHQHNWFRNELDIGLGIRHFKSGVKFLDYDTGITLLARDSWYELFLEKQAVEGLNNIQALQFMVAEADSSGLIDELITIY